MEKITDIDAARAARRRRRDDDDGGSRAGGWKADLICNEKGEPKPILANALLALRAAPALHGVAAFNEFTGEVELPQRPPWARASGGWSARPWTDNDDRLLAEWLQREDIFVTENVAGQAVETVARERPFHPIRDFLESIVWDGERRLEGWCSTYLGVADTEYARAIGRRWLISAVARVYEPGCKADCVLILEGDQGVGKSRALATLGGGWFTDRLSDITGKDAAQELGGVWVIEIAELDAISKADTSAIKAFISRTHDRYRPPYGKRVIERARQCVFAGSVNPMGGYFKDPTGARRLWPVRCGKVDIDRLKADRDQLWAEARDLYHSGHAWWLETPELETLATAEQADRYRGDPWEAGIGKLLDGVEDISVPEVLDGLGLDRSRWGQVEQTRVAEQLASNGFKRYRARHGTTRSWRYRRKALP
jgi:predicted P-loop ATPase